MIHKSRRDAIVPLKRNGEYVPVKGTMEEYYDPEYGAHRIAPKFFPEDAPGKPVTVTSSMLRWIDRVDKYPCDLDGRIERLNKMASHGLDGKYVKSKFFFGPRHKAWEYEEHTYLLKKACRIPEIGDYGEVEGYYDGYDDVALVKGKWRDVKNRINFLNADLEPDERWSATVIIEDHVIDVKDFNG